VDEETSNDLICQITSGDLIKKPGWIRMSIHPTTTSEEIKFVCESIKALAANQFALGD
jgi:selenocysteine lyase/cysteine desulfurase